jgi:hypothetical protein
MKPPLPGVFPPELGEVTAMTVWPSIGAHPLGRLIGRLSASRAGIGVFTLGNFWALASIPFGLALYFWMRMPYLCHRYTLTNRRIIIRRGLDPRDEKWLELDDFDSCEVETLPGQQWLHSGDLVFHHGEIEVLRLAGVPRPIIFRNVCLTAHAALFSIRKVVQQQAAVVKDTA